MTTKTTTPQTWTFEAYDPTYKGWKTVVVENITTQAGAQMQLQQEGYTRVRTGRQD
jgi:hypothetical protein